ncbi:pollen Ole e 1 allergen and extensin family protein [Carex rostrata]
MARFFIPALVAVAMILMSANNAYGNLSTTAQEFTIYGKVLCQDCTQGWNTFANGATPIPEAKVDVICPDKNGRPVYHVSDLTDETGEFRFTIPYNYNGLILDPKDAIVRLVSSPSSCNILTNFNRGKDGVSPQNPTTWRHDKVEYECGPFYFTIPQCGVPE